MENPFPYPNSNLNVNINNSNFNSNANVMNLMLEDKKYMHQIIKFLKNEELLNLICVNKFYFNNLKRSKLLIKNMKRDYNKE